VHGGALESARQDAKTIPFPSNPVAFRLSHVGRLSMKKVRGSATVSGRRGESIVFALFGVCCPDDNESKFESRTPRHLQSGIFSPRRRTAHSTPTRTGAIVHVYRASTLREGERIHSGVLVHEPRPDRTTDHFGLDSPQGL